MQAKTALERRNNGVEARFYHCVDSLVLRKGQKTSSFFGLPYSYSEEEDIILEGRVTPPLLDLYSCSKEDLEDIIFEGRVAPAFLGSYSSSEEEAFEDTLESRVAPPLPGLYSSSEEEAFKDIILPSRVAPPLPGLYSSSEEEAIEDIILEGRVTPPLRLFDHLNSHTYEKLLEQNLQLFEELDQEPSSSSRAHEDVPEDLGLLDSPKVMDSIMPEPTCLTSVIQAMVIHPSSKKVPKKRRRKPWGRRPRKKAIMVSDDENNDEVKPEVEDPPDGMVGRSAFQESCHPEQPVGTPTSPRVLPAAPITASEVSSFAEHLARCAVDWDYPRVLSPRGGYESDPFSQKMTPPQAGETFTPPVSAQPLSPLALEQSPTPTRSTSNRVSRKRRHASSDLSAGSERPQAPQTSAGRSVGPENVEPTTKPARRRKRRRLFR